MRVSLTTWIALIGAVGVGSIVAAVVGWWSAKAVAISGHRQVWINAIQDDLVSYLKQIDRTHFAVGKLSSGTTDDLQRLQDVRDETMFAYRRILLRLNVTEPPHIELAQKLLNLQLVSKKTADADKIDDAINAARIVLKGVVGKRLTYRRTGEA